MATHDYRLPKRTALKKEDAELAWAVIEPIWSLPFPKGKRPESSGPWRFVTKGQLFVYAVTWLEREVINGGFAQYFWNSTGSFFQQALDGFEAFGEQPYAELLKKAGSVFPGGIPSPSRTQRMDAIRRIAREHRADVQSSGSGSGIEVLNDTVFDVLNDQFYEMYGRGAEYYSAMARYISSHPEEFFK